MPAAALGSFIISTDSPMLFFMLASMLLLAPLARGETLSLRETLLAGIFAGLAMMAKYAALYLPAGVVLWWLWQGRRDFRPDPRFIGVFVLGMLVSLAPNIIWNLMNGFVTVGHLEHNADLGGTSPSWLRSIGFLAAQAGIVGPLMLILVIMALAATWRDRACRFWIALAAPALMMITAQAYLSNANANWAAASWPSLVVLTAHGLASSWQGWMKRAGQVALGLNGVIALGLVAVTISGSFGPLTPASDPLRRLRGWQDHAAMLTPLISETGAKAVVTTRRGHAAKLHWLLRDIPVAVELIDSNGVAENHFEQNHPWQPQPGRVIILVHGNPVIGHEESLTPIAPARESRLAISRKRDRQLYFHAAVER